MSYTLSQVTDRLKSLADEKRRKILSHYAVDDSNAWGIRMPDIRKIGREIGKDHILALELWKEGHHESRLLATLIADPQKTSLSLIDQWVKDIYSWDVCDQLCINLLVNTSFKWELPDRYAVAEEEYIRRVGLVMIVALRIHDKKAKDEQFEAYFPLLKKYATDERNFVKKAVNWVIRELGKRSPKHHPEMTALCLELLETDSKSAAWIARDALRELESEKILKHLGI